jgi:hypothetical protein
LPQLLTGDSKSHVTKDIFADHAWIFPFSPFGLYGGFGGIYNSFKDMEIIYRGNISSVYYSFPS